MVRGGCRSIGFDEKLASSKNQQPPRIEPRHLSSIQECAQESVPDVSEWVRTRRVAGSPLAVGQMKSTTRAPKLRILRFLPLQSYPSPRKDEFWWRRRELNPRPRKFASEETTCVSSSVFVGRLIRNSQEPDSLARLISAYASEQKASAQPAK